MTRESERREGHRGRVFVLRMWRDESEQNGRFTRRYILEDPFSRARRGFANLEELTIYLDTLHLPKQA